MCNAKTSRYVPRLRRGKLFQLHAGSALRQRIASAIAQLCILLQSCKQGVMEPMRCPRRIVINARIIGMFKEFDLTKKISSENIYDT